jgi:hypothetical protein
MELVPGLTLERVIPRHGLGLKETLDYGIRSRMGCRRRMRPASSIATPGMGWT